ncbi:MmgE/PrpD family protein [Sphingobium sp. V4]|uniref:MmgE/PrpD family protein n=1 Tax=Sphingobium sp. V4 TaxID=3038927 RepID=UPI0025580C2B|nr:MmgE/PrpD family protein [Sphingobium sp. V4]WIW89428.1 MmgE/PrpD family protein [Sphingobium sp. V4]
MSVAAALGRFVARSANIPAPGEVVRYSTRALVDWSGAMIAGWTEPAMVPIRAAVADELGQGASTVFGRGSTRAPPRTAALLNGSASHAIEMDDIYAPGLYHPGSPTIASALAVAEAVGATGADLLRAIAIGYEVGNRIAEAIQPEHYRFWHTTGTVGCMGASAAAAALLKLDEGQCGHAIAASATFAAGLQQAFRSEAMLKPLHAGRAAEAGVFAAMAASHGLSGEPAIFEGAAGFGAATSRNVEWGGAIAALGSPWTICRMTQKIHACCGHAFAPIDGALALRGLAGPVSGIRNIRIETYPVAVDVAGNMGPTTPYEAKFSIGFCVATALVFGEVGPAAFTFERLADPALRALRGRVTLTRSSRFEAEFPAMRGAAIEIETADGRRLRHDQPTRLGSPEFPVTDEQLSDKFRRLAGATLGDLTDSVLDGLWTTAQGPRAGLEANFAGVGRGTDVALLGE